MKILFRIVQVLPMTKLCRIDLKRRLVTRSYAKDVRQAETCDDREKLAWALADERHELAVLDEEEAHIRSTNILSQARRLEVPRPLLRDSEHKLTSDWEEGYQTYKYRLSDSGRAKLREEIRKEQKARHDERVRWLAWVTPLIGIAGIVVTLLTKGAK